MAGPVVWNSIPAAVREAETASSFKRKLKTHFFLCALTMLDFDFLRATAVPAGTAETRISYGNSVCPSVRLSVCHDPVVGW